MSTILSLAPQNVWKHFYSLTQIPRPSGHMEKITEFLLDFGKNLAAGRPRESTAPVQTSVRLTKKENTNVSSSTPLSSTPAKPLTIAAGSVMFIMTAERNRASCTRNSPALFNKYPPASTAR